MEAQAQQKSWFSRNWMWFIPVSGCATLILLLVLGVGAAFFGINNLISNSTPYKYAIERAEENEQVIAILGEPIETDGIMQGNISLKNDDGNADISIPIEGPKGKAKIHAKATKTDGDWFYEELYVEISKTNEQINLLPKSTEDF